ncbi:MAG: glycosyltransferase [Thermoplasmata archaeon]|nr:glycosyltransferase [Thermoplasmata archaeon]
MKVSIITVCFNNDSTIKDTIDSVLNQSYKNIEYIIIDGDSADKTKDIITSYGNKIDQFVSESDRGIYHAMNKGIKLVKGDIVGMLNADDFFCDYDIIEKLVKEFVTENLDAVFGDVQFVNSQNLKKIVRYYSSKHFHPSKFKYGFMPAHPSFYVKRELFSKYGYYSSL